MLLSVEQALSAVADSNAAVPMRREVAKSLGEIMTNP
jgi:hypothetical protein